MKTLLIGLALLVQAHAQVLSGTSIKAESLMSAPSVGGTVATPTDTPGTGTYTGSQAATLHCSTSGCVICATTDGSTPTATTPGTCSNGTAHADGAVLTDFTVTSTLKLLGTFTGMTNSSVSGSGSGSVYTIVPVSTGFSVTAAVINTEAVLSYTAPSNTVCTVSISETSGGPPVHDVDPTLFTNSNLDSRAGALVNGTHRVFVVGKRTVEPALDSQKYSRALQNSTVHYYAISGCGSASGAFTTANIPIGSTYSDAPDHNMPTLSLTDRSQKMVDNKTGALVRRVSLRTDQYNVGPRNGPNTGFGGTVRMCGNQIVGPDNGYLCAFPGGDGAQGAFYYIIPSTGEARFLGRAIGEFGGNQVQPHIDPTDSMIYIAHENDVTRYAYAGDWQNAAPNSFASFTSQVFIPTSIASVIAAFDPTFNLFTGPEVGTANSVNNGANSDITWVSGDVFTTAMVGNQFVIAGGNSETVLSFTDSHHIKITRNQGALTNSAWSRPQPLLIVDGPYGFIHVGKYIQNSYGGTAILDMGNRLPIGSCGSNPALCPHIVAAANTVSKGVTRFCGDHVIAMLPGSTGLPLALISEHELVGPDNGNSMFPGVFEGGYVYDSGAPGMGPYYTRLNGALTVGQTNIVVDGEMASPNAPDSFLQNVQVGDNIILRDTSGASDQYTITAKADAQHWTISPPVVNAKPDRARVVAGCKRNWVFQWKFLDNPAGDDTTNTSMVTDLWQSQHEDWGSILRVQEGWIFAQGPVLTTLGLNPSLTITNSPPFAGVTGKIYGNSAQSYPTYHQVNLDTNNMSWVLDNLAMDGSDLWNPQLTLVSSSTAQLWKYQPAVDTSFNRKVLPTLVVSKGNIFTDISGPGSSLTDGIGDAYKYCHVVAAGECHAGSIAGEVYANTPASSGRCQHYGDDDLCVIPNPVNANNMTQIGTAITDTPEGAGVRVLTGMFNNARVPAGAQVSKSLPDGSYALTTMWDETSTWDNGASPPLTAMTTEYVFMAKIPPFPSVVDGVDRSTFVRNSVSITTPTGLGITTATVEFGYSEFNGFCTSRAETCLAVSSTVTDSNPFFFKGSETYTKAPCSSSCTITLPVLPAHVAYYTVKFYNAGGTFVQNGETGVVAETAKVALP